MDEEYRSSAVQPTPADWISRRKSDSASVPSKKIETEVVHRQVGAWDDDDDDIDYAKLSDTLGLTKERKLMKLFSFLPESRADKTGFQYRQYYEASAVCRYQGSREASTAGRGQSTR